MAAPQPRAPPPVRTMERAANGDWHGSQIDYSTLCRQAHEQRTYFAFLESEHIQSQPQLETDLSDNFLIPGIFWHELCLNSNGFFGSFESIEGAARKCHRTWLRILIKRVAHLSKRSEYEWLGMSFFTQFREPDSMAILCFDVPEDIQLALVEAAKRVPRPTTLEQVYAWHCDMLDQVILAFYSSVWGIRDVVRNFEKNRPMDINVEVDFDNLHDNARHVIHSSETLGVTIDAVEAMMTQHESLKDISDAFITLTVTDTDKLRRKLQHRQIRNRLYGHVQTLKALRFRAQSNEARLKNEISLAFNTVSQRDSIAMIRLSLAATGDSRAMKQIAFVTLLLLPATAVSTMFSSAFFNFQPKTQSDKTQVSEDFWIFWVITVPLTFLVWLAWRWTQNVTQESKEDEYTLRRATTRRLTGLSRGSTRIH